jgi:hypothetical protein
VAGVERVLRTKATESLPGLTPLDDRWLAIPRPLPYARIVERLVESREPARELSTISVETTALVDRPPQSPFADALCDFEPRILMVDQRPGRLTVIGECASSRGSLLVLAERFHPGWRATVNGLPVEVVRTNGEFLGCPTAPLHFVAQFEFLPDSLRYGQWLTAAGLIILAIYCTARGCLP